MATPTQTEQVDVLIVGSGPVGAAYARVIADQQPGASILMIDLGPKLTAKAGQHVKNIAEAPLRIAAQVMSQGPDQFEYRMATMPERVAAARSGEVSFELLARPGTHLLTTEKEAIRQSDMPAAAFASNVGGAGAHWTCACPRPGNTERINFIPDDEYEHAFAKAEKLLCVTQDAFADTFESQAILKKLGETFNQELHRPVQKMPLACKIGEDGQRYWVGSDIILGDLAEPGYQGNFELRAGTMCRQLLTEGSRVTGAVIEHLSTGIQTKVQAKVVIVCADALRTPQLLWASNIRPRALGHYLNEHPLVLCFVQLDEELLDPKVAKNDIMDPTVGVFWVPFDEPGHPFHAQVMHVDVSPVQIETADKTKHVVGLGWGCPKELRFEDCIEFSATETDHLGMPRMNLIHKFTERDLANIEGAKREQAKAAAAFGKQVSAGEQTLVPAGTSLHYQGTLRMGETNDGNSVCDSYSNMWGYDNLFVGGNGVIPTAATCNPTLTSVAMAVRSASRVIEKLQA